MRYADNSFVAYGPDTFVSLIKNARCVVSNSFHGSAFSMIYGKDFFVVNRKDGLNIRMKDLLNRYGLESRLISDETHDNSRMATIDYNLARPSLDVDITSSKAFLNQQIELV